MEQNLSDLLSDAFSETSVPSFPDGDLDFENLNFDEKLEEDETDISHENSPAKEDRALHQEATGETTVLSIMKTEDTHMAENAVEEQSDDDDDDDDDEEEEEEEEEEEDFQGVRVGLMSMDRTPEEDYASSDGDSEQEASGEDDEDEEVDMGEEPGESLMSLCCGGEEKSCYGGKEDRIFAEGQPLAPEAAENSQVRNKEQGESERDEEASYFGRVPERCGEMTIKGDGIEEDEEERGEEKQDSSSDSEREAVKVEQEENTPAQCLEQEVENPYKVGPATASLEFPEISAQNLQDLIAEVDGEEYEEKMKDFSGEEHQEAGESFADYPSDFSSCEYVEDGVKNRESNSKSNPALLHMSGSDSNAKQNVCLEGAMTDITWMGKEEYADEEEDGYLYSIDLEMDAEKFRSFNVAAGEEDGKKTEIVEDVSGYSAVTASDDQTSESESYSSSDDEVQHRRRDEDPSDCTCMQDLENNKKLEDTWLYSEGSAAFSRWSSSDSHPITSSIADTADFSVNWDFDVSKTASLLSEDLLTTEDTDKTETPLSDVSQRPAEDINSYSVVQREDGKTTSPSYQGSVDDSFFFNTGLEASEVTELGQLGDDEYEEEERNWEQEQERIKAFYKFYDDSKGEYEREERQIKVQFCADPVIHYESDSDRDSLSSSTDREEDLSSADTSEELREPDDTLQMIPVCDPPNIQLQEERVPDNMTENVLENVTENMLENDLSNTKICTRKHKCLGMLKLILKMGVVTGTGLLMFWLATDQLEWLSQASFFWG
ncbi:uncharacterized protein si:dkey-183p4.10 isoform X2 [Lates calcarifer]|uniref:Uncharacterized protein si:dkey-183p4.10 isoform X2 n=1 Tax=Lates calcarifer TaxID=8187 RepID=A0AAJ7LET0_LATCA|nr:uncharacterized protein si:dkey-183p4.10 isoform X2 [Lates calcarifer]